MTLGLSPCPNDTYIFHALLHHLVPSPAHFTPHMADVEELNALARQKKLPVTKLSLGVVPYIMDDYAIMASGAALGWGCGHWWWPARTCPKKNGKRPAWPCRAS